MRSACLRSIPSRSAARCMSISRKVRPIRKLDASAATFFASLASRWVATTLASPRFLPRHIRLDRREREAARVLGHLAGRRGGEHLRFVHHHQRRIPVLARRVEQRGKEQRGAADLLLELELLERQHDRSPVLPHPSRQGFDLCRKMRRSVDDDMVEIRRQGC